MDRHFNDEYVKLARREGYRSRAAFKLLEIQAKDDLLRPGMRVVDLGAAPGGWSQIAQRIVGDSGAVVGVDLLPVEPLSGIVFIEADFRETEALEALAKALNGQYIDLVLSDMAPNVSGTAAVDQPRSIYLCELALEFCRSELRRGGSLVVKVFQGEGFDAYYRAVNALFGRVVTRKPKASRPRSREVYVVARDFKG